MHSASTHANNMLSDSVSKSFGWVLVCHSVYYIWIVYLQQYSLATSLSLFVIDKHTHWHAVFQQWSCEKPSWWKMNEVKWRKNSKEYETGETQAVRCGWARRERQYRGNSGAVEQPWAACETPGDDSGECIKGAAYMPCADHLEAPACVSAWRVVRAAETPLSAPPPRFHLPSTFICSEHFPHLSLSLMRTLHHSSPGACLCVLTQWKGAAWREKSEVPRPPLLVSVAGRRSVAVWHCRPQIVTKALGGSVCVCFQGRSSAADSSLTQ